MVIDDNVQPLEKPEPRGQTVNLKSGHTSEQTSLLFHDYVGLVKIDGINNTLNKDCQTHIWISSTSVCTQTPNTDKSDASTQTEMIFDEHETYYATKLCDCLQKSEPIKTFANSGTQCNKPTVTIEDINSDEKCMFYTGVPNKQVFYTLFDEMSDASEKNKRNASNSNSGTGRPRSLRLIDEFFIVLMRLRLGLLLGDLADRFFISKSTCGVICEKWIEYLHLKLAFLTDWPSRELVNKFMPNKFSRKYPNCRVIIDCTEFFTETPQSLSNKSLMFSSYKSHMTYKALLGISPAGIITFVSDLWSGSISDKQITKQCGILELCEKGDAIMADKGFLITDLTTPLGIDMIIPPFKTHRFSRREVEETRRIANLRIDVERAMERVKNFRILSGVIPITLSKRVSKMLKICVDLSNLQFPLVHDDP